MRRPNCRCAEDTIVLYDVHKKIVGKRSAPPVHNCVYIERRNELIDQAEGIADHRVGRHHPAWGQVFLEVMNSLARCAREEGRL